VIPVDEALDKVMSTSSPLGDEVVELDDSLGRILAEPVLARDTIPQTHLSAMDGFAVRSADTADEPYTLRMLGDIPAGKAPDEPVGEGQTWKIFTGAVLPEGADAVVMVERTRTEGDVVHFEAGVAPRGQHVRDPGEVVTEGQEVLDAGVRLGPGHLGLLATLGYPEVRCGRRPVVGIMPTGDELLPVHEPLRPGMVRDSNSRALKAQVLRAGGVPVMLGVAVDDRAALKSKVAEALDSCDVLITSGGVSMGDYDFVGEVLEELGCAIHFTRVRTKPGKPVTYATRDEVQVFGLPGNPVSSMVSFELFCRPALRARMGARSPHRRKVDVELAHDIRKKGARRDFQRATLEWTEGRWVARVTGPQGSGIMVSMATAQVLLELHEDRSEFATGSTVPAILLDEALEAETV
jgi:molybdenum cofactor synthesis domain-containing protein